MPPRSSSARGLAISRRGVRGGCLISLSGPIDESLDQTEVIAGASGVVIFDLDGVDQITSYGVRKWREMLPALSADYVGFIRCRPQMTVQFNSVARFNCGGELITFYAPYTCPACRHYQEVLIDLRKQHAEVKAFNPPPVSCAECGAPSQFDDLAEAYFYFAAYAPAPSPPPLANTLIDRVDGRADVPFRLEKDVDGDVTALWLTGTLDRNANLSRLAQGLEGKVVLVVEGLLLGEGGMERLRGILDLPELALFLARVPPELAQALADDPHGLGQARACSFRVPCQCERCLANCETDVEPALTGAFLLGGKLGVCERCGGSVKRAAPLDLVESVRRLRVEAPPADVQAYLDAHPHPPAFGFASPAVRPESSPQALGRYELVERIAAGGMSEVFLARQSGAGGFEKRVVIKRILPNLAVNRSFVKMFLDEARLAARISHPNVVQTLDVGQLGAEYFIALEYVRGIDLNRLLELAAHLQMPLEPQIAARVVADACNGLHAAHTSTDELGKLQPIVHRDVSPHNILISTEGVVKLTDFGIAKVANSRRGTPTKAVKGKLTYLAPELLRGQSTALDPRIDVFAAGVVLYQCLTLRHPFKRSSEVQVLRAILEDPIPPPSLNRHDLPSELDGIVERALARDLARRYATAAEFADQLEAVISKLSPTGPKEVAVWLQALIEGAKRQGGIDVDDSATVVRIGPLGTDEEGDTPTIRDRRG